MNRLRLSLAALMAVIGLVAIGIAALRFSKPLWASAVFSLAVALFSVGILGACTPHGRFRMAWLGFAAFGWIRVAAQ